MKANAQALNRISEGPLPGPKEEKREATSSDGHPVVVMIGRAASPGTAIGRAVVVMSKDDIPHVKEGMVVVSEKASPKLGVVIPKVCAIATEYGGMGAAASIFAREYGIPAVVSVPGLTKIVRDGDLLLVDGMTGTVKIIKPKA